MLNDNIDMNKGVFFCECRLGSNNVIEDLLKTFY